MFTGLNDLISQILGFFQWWIVVAPWEGVIRVRRGNHTAVLKPGIHFRIPVLDRFFVQHINKRFINTPTQAITTKDRQAVTVSGGASYRIADIDLLYRTLSQPEDVIQIETMALIAQYVATHDLAEITPLSIQDHVTKLLDLARYGLGDTAFQVTDFVSVRTYRIINSNPKDYSTYGGLDLQTEKQVGKPGLR